MCSMRRTPSLAPSTWIGFAIQTLPDTAVPHRMNKLICIFLRAHIYGWLVPEICESHTVYTVNTAPVWKRSLQAHSRYALTLHDNRVLIRKLGLGNQKIPMKSPGGAPSHTMVSVKSGFAACKLHHPRMQACKTLACACVYMCSCMRADEHACANVCMLTRTDMQNKENQEKTYRKLWKLRSATQAVRSHVRSRDQKPYRRDTRVGCQSRRARPTCGLGWQQARPRIQCTAGAQGSLCRR